MVHESDAQRAQLQHAAVTKQIIVSFYEVYNELRAGFLESVYHAAMFRALADASLQVRREVPIEVFFRGAAIGRFFADLVVEDCVVIELKCARSIAPEHEAQLIHYLRATGIEVGMLLNFGSRPQFKRLVYSNALKPALAGNHQRPPV